jgi:adenylate cyclase
MVSGIEIERKFVPGERPDDLDRYPSEPIEQGYLTASPGDVEVRIRRRGEHRFLTVKSAPATVRVEEELAIDERCFRSLWPLTAGRRVSKRRFYIPLGAGLQVELDVYEGELEGLLTAEVEFDSEPASATFRAPAWLGEEVTDDPRYSNRALAIDGLPR